MFINIGKALFNFVFLFYLTDQYGLATQGVYSYYVAIIGVVYGLLGIKTEVLLLNSDHRNDEKFPSQVFTAAVLLRVLGGLVLVSFVPLSELFILILIKYFLDVVKSHALVAYRRSQNLNKFNSIELAEVLLKLVCVYVFETIELAFTAILCGVLIKCSFYYFDILKNKYVLARPRVLVVLRNNFIASSISSVVKRGDKILLKQIIGFEALGQYSLYMVFFSAFTDFLKFTADFNTEDYDKFKNVRKSIIKICIVSLIPLSTLLILINFGIEWHWIVQYFGADYLIKFVPICLLFPILTLGLFPGVYLDIKGLYLSKAAVNLLASLIYVILVMNFYNGLLSLLYCNVILWGLIVSLNTLIYFKISRT